MEFAKTWLDIIGTSGILATLIVLIKYTIETAKLRRISLKQVEISLRPCISLYWEVDYVEAHGPQHKKCIVKNVGNGTAFNIEIDPISLFATIDLLESIKTEELMLISSPEGRIFYNHDLKKIFPGKDFINLNFRYKNIENQMFLSTIRISSKDESINFIETKRTDADGRQVRGVRAGDPGEVR